MPKQHVLTDAQAEVIDEIYSRYGLDKTFVPLEMYPSRSNKGGGGRRTITNLVERGLIEKVPHTDDGHFCLVEGGKCYRLRLTRAALHALHQHTGVDETPLGAVVAAAQQVVDNAKANGVTVIGGWTGYLVSTPAMARLREALLTLEKTSAEINANFREFFGDAPREESHEKMGWE